MNEEFKKGREYERKHTSMSLHFWMGGGCLTMAPVWFFFSVWDFDTKLKGWVSLTLFGAMSLLLAYSDKKEIKNYE